MLESQWRFAAGQSVQAESSFLEPSATEGGLLALEIIPNQRTSTTKMAEADGLRWPPVLPAMSFVPAAPLQRLSLLRDFFPQRGAREQVNGLLVLAPPEARDQVLLVRVAAF